MNNPSSFRLSLVMNLMNSRVKAPAASILASFYMASA